MSINKRLINTGVEAAPAAFDPLQNFETVTYTGNGGTQKITGYIRKGAAFNGSSSKIEVNSPIVNVSNDYTVSMWLNTSDVTTFKGIYENINTQEDLCNSIISNAHLNINIINDG